MKKNKNEIPKIIHYCWFGRNPKPELVLKCIESWKKYCPDYEIKEWNEDNFDLNYNAYVKEAYENKKWAFVTDVVRLYALVNYGGIYMDTDVEVIKPLDGFLSLSGLSGFESPDRIPTGLMACREGHAFFKKLLDDYKNRHFVKKDGSLDLTTNVEVITNICLKHGLILNNQKQTVEDFTLFPSEYFCPKDFKTGVLNITENTYTIHHFDGSWMPHDDKKLHDTRRKLCKMFGKTLGMFLYKIYNLGYRGISKIKELGIIGTIKLGFKKIFKKSKGD